jgi:uncharacterized protein YkwD
MSRADGPRAIGRTNGGEEPNPLPDDPDGRAGFPITAFFPNREPLLGATGKLFDADGKEVACWFSSPEKPANPKFAAYQRTTVCLIAKDPLKPDHTYEVHLKGELAGKAWEQRWKFTTADDGLSAKKAADIVIARINRIRVRAGLNPATLDERLSRGCRLHAQYLAKNADVLAKTNANVNDENPKLPWFTQDGLRAAQQSLVFTNAPRPVLQIDDLLGTAFSREYLLKPSWQRVGFGCAHDIGKGWRCVLDVNSGHGNSRVVVYPGPDETDVPASYPISIAFPHRAGVRNIQAVVRDAAGAKVDVKLIPLDESLIKKLQHVAVAIQPAAPLRANHTYSVTASAIVNATEWRRTWQFTTAK